MPDTIQAKIDSLRSSESGQQGFNLIEILNIISNQFTRGDANIAELIDTLERYTKLKLDIENSIEELIQCNIYWPLKNLQAAIEEMQSLMNSEAVPVIGVENLVEKSLDRIGIPFPLIYKSKDYIMSLGNNSVLALIISSYGLPRSRDLVKEAIVDYCVRYQDYDPTGFSG